MAAARTVISCEVRCTINRSPTTSVTMNATNTIHTQMGVWKSANLPASLACDASSTRLTECPTSPGIGGGSSQDGLGGREPGDRHPERRAGDVVEAGGVEEGDRVGIAAMLTAHAELEVG